MPRIREIRINKGEAVAGGHNLIMLLTKRRLLSIIER
jgi:hypothetical protein